MAIVSGAKQAQISIKRSKFLGFVFCVDQVKQVEGILEDLAKQHKGAAHIVYAYRFLDNGVLREKFDNDKEPVGSAGQPILYLLQKKEIINCLLVVVRYFGGIKLGTGGLVRAYTEAAQAVLVDNLKLQK